MIEQYCRIRNTNATVDMKIVLKDDVPVHQHPRRQSYSHQNFVDEILVAKKNRKMRLCCDYRKINKKIIQVNFPIAHMDNDFLLLCYCA